MRNKIGLIVLICIFCIAFVLRFYKLSEVPYGFYQDESAIGYNAYSLLKTGHDEHGAYLPLYFKSFGDYKLPVYIYAAALPIKIFGLTEFAVRFPSAFFGFLTVIIFYFFVKELTKNRSLSLISTAFLAISPWHLHYSRATFEVSISLFLFVLGGLLLYKSFYNKTRFAFLFGTVCFVISFYSYNLTRLLAPALYLLFLILNKSQVKKVSKKEQLLTVFLSSVLFIPFFLTLFQSGGVASAGGTLIFSSKAAQAPLLEFRSYFVEVEPLIVKLFFSTLPLTVWQYLQNLVSYFSSPFFFVFGSSHGNHGIGNVGQFYLFQFPLMALGIIYIISEKQPWIKLLILWGLLSILVASLTREVPHATRSFFLIVPFEIFSGLGVLLFFSWLINKKLWYRTLALVLGIGLVVYNIVFYFASYYGRFPILYAREWRAQDKAVSFYIKENLHRYDNIIFDDHSGFVYTSLLFYLRYPPSNFQKEAVWAKDDSEGFSKLKSFGKFAFRNIDWTKDYKAQKTLFITTAGEKPKEIAPLKVFFYPKRPVVLAIKQKIVGYPIEDIAYVLVETK